MKKCFIITSYIEGDLSKIISFDARDFILCADGGYEIAMSHNITPALVIGDSDSGGMADAADSRVKFIHFSSEKDESDTFLCVKHAVGLGFDDITIIGGIGGRLDHTISNIQTLAYFSNSVKRIAMTDEKNFITILENSRITLEKKDGFTLSLFSLSDVCKNVTTTGLYYALKDFELKNSYPLGLSNKFTDNTATVAAGDGKLLIVMSAE